MPRQDQRLTLRRLDELLASLHDYADLNRHTPTACRRAMPREENPPEHDPTTHGRHATTQPNAPVQRARQHAYTTLDQTLAFTEQEHNTSTTQTTRAVHAKDYTPTTLTCPDTTSPPAAVTRPGK